MMPPRADFHFLRRSLFFLLFAACLGGASLVYGEYRFARAERSLHSAHRQIEAAQHAAAVAAALRREAENSLPEYRALSERGVIGAAEPDESVRLHLIAGMERIREHHPLPHFGYDIQPRQIQPLPPSSAAGAYGLSGNRMDMHLVLRHEGQLAGLLDTLREDTHGLFAPERCTLERSGQEIEAECTGNWLRLQKHGEQAE